MISIFFMTSYQLIWSVCKKFQRTLQVHSNRRCLGTMAPHDFVKPACGAIVSEQLQCHSF